MNKIIIKGRLTANPELKTTQNDKSFTFVSVAVNRRFNKEETDFINCCAFGKTAEFIVKYFGKGQEILCTGELHIDTYEKDGQKRTTAKVVIDEVEFCGSKTESQNSPKNDNYEKLDDYSVEDDEELPF